MIRDVRQLLEYAVTRTAITGISMLPLRRT